MISSSAALGQLYTFQLVSSFTFKIVMSVTLEHLCVSSPIHKQKNQMVCDFGKTMCLKESIFSRFSILRRKKSYLNLISKNTTFITYCHSYPESEMLWADVFCFFLNLARAALLSGRLPIRNGFYTNNDHARNGETKLDLSVPWENIQHNIFLLQTVLLLNKMVQIHVKDIKICTCWLWEIYWFYKLMLLQFFLITGWALIRILNHIQQLISLKMSEFKDWLYSPS